MMVEITWIGVHLVASKKPQIFFSENNPYIVRGVNIIEDCDGSLIPAKPTMALCRCGKSEGKPFCDGKHTELGFENETKQKHSGTVKVYKGRDITITFDLQVCSHSAVCIKELPAVFNLRRRPWINPDGAEYKKIIKIIDACPSGALKYCLHDQEHLCRTRDPQDAQITLVEDGPYNVQGEIELCGDTPSPAVHDRYCLCRCGQTGNTPFCDGTHLGIEKTIK
jgi:uncharacterized Fe-S cluster protein YjdI